MSIDTPNRRRVARALRAGGPEVLDVTAEDLPPPAAGEALVRVEAAGLNHADTLLRSGTYSLRLPFPFDVGIEGAGVVVAAGPGVSIEAGTRVCWTAVFGSCATYVNARAALLAPLPDDMTFEVAASLTHGGVAASGLVRHCPLAAGSTAVVWAAAGAVGLMLTACLSEGGVSVIGIASGSRVEAVRRAGATFVIDRITEDVVEAVRRYTGGRGAAAVFDPVGAAAYGINLRLLAPRGVLVNYGQLSGDLPSIDLKQLMDAGSIFVTKYGPHAGLIGPQHLAAVIADALATATRCQLAPEIAARLPLDRVADGYRLMESHRPGKVLVLPWG